MGNDRIGAQCLEPPLQVFVFPEGPVVWFGQMKKTTGGKNHHRNVNYDIMPIYVRTGAIIPFDPVRQYTGQPVIEPYYVQKIYRE